MEGIYERWKASDQSHVLQFWDQLNDQQKAELTEQLQKIEQQLGSIDRIKGIHQQAVHSAQSSMTESSKNLLPLSEKQVKNAKNTEQKTSWTERGFEQIRQGHVAVVLLAGGQGTRLGSTKPKGMYDIQLLSHKSLFQIQAERIRKVCNLAFQDETSVSIPWYIMTSESTGAETTKFFESQNYFGLDPRNVVFFEQNTLPATTSEGKVVMESKSKVLESPDGNGGMYAALKQNEILEDMTARGISTIFVYGVDNVLVRIADPVFIGYFLESGAECGAKVVPKSSPEERVGIFGLRNSKVDIVEYSELSAEMANRRGPDGNLVFNAGNIVTHIYTLDFLKRFANHHLQDLVHHIAKKVMTVLDDRGNLNPVEVWKYEQFIFDAFPAAESFVALEVERFEEFSPLKNASGVDSPGTCLSAIYDLHTKYLRDAGVDVKDNTKVELSPLVSFAGEGLSNAREALQKKIANIDHIYIDKL